MTEVFTENNEQLQEIWKEFTPDIYQYLDGDKLKEWVKLALEKTNTMPNFQQSLTDLEGLIKQYLAEVQNATEEELQNVSMNYSEGVDFLKWLTFTQSKPEDKQQEEPEPKQEKEEKQEENPVNEEEPLAQPQRKQGEESPAVVKNESSLKKSQNQIEMQRSISNPQLKNSDVRSNKGSVLQNSSQVQSPKKTKTEMSVRQEENQNTTVNPNQFNLEYISKKYKDYLRIIFEHYCKISYATGNDPTFEQIKHKTTVMTINKFMMFCKDFQIGKVDKSINRAFLVQIFKKNSVCYKEMSFQQFCQVFSKLAVIGFGKEQKKEQKGQENELDQDMVSMLEFCQLSTQRKFREKMKKLNIQYRAGPKTNAQMKVVPDGYRFKFAPTNGKSEEQVKQEIQERKQHRSERKILLQEKINNQQVVQPLQYRKRVASKRTERVHSRDKQLAPIRQYTNVQSTNALNKVLSPPIPPARKPSNLPPNPPRTAALTPVSVSNHPSAQSQNNTNIFKKEMGYAQIHKMKQSEGYGRKKGLNKSTNKDASNFRLNSIVEEARMEVQEVPSRDMYSDNLTESIATNSREEANRSKNYDIAKINMKMQLISEKNQRDKQMQEELGDLLDMSNDDDQFLRKHLEKEKKTEGMMNKRVSQRLNQIGDF